MDDFQYLRLITYNLITEWIHMITISMAPMVKDVEIPDARAHDHVIDAAAWKETDGLLPIQQKYLKKKKKKKTIV